MNIDTLRSAVVPSILGLAVSAVVASAGVSAEEKETLLDEAIHDYVDDARDSNRETPPVYGRGNTYHNTTLLDQAYHDYNSEEVAAFNKVAEPRPQQEAEFAAFEVSTSTKAPWEISSEVDW